jgi:predicted flavoprotein YhiN
VNGSLRHIAVIGAGAAGLTAALRAADSGARVTLLNAHPKVGLKILMSGGTRCNVTHREVVAEDFNGGSRAFVARVLRAFTPEQTREWFETLGVTLKLEGTGKYFPETDDARTVLNALLGAARRAGITLRPGARVLRLVPVWSTEAAPLGRVSAIDQPSRAFRIGIQHVRESAAFDAGAVSAHRERSWTLPAGEPEEWLAADAVVLAAGGLSFPRTGSDGTGFALVTALGHTLEPPVPALTPLTASDPLCDAAQGMTLNAALTLRVDGRAHASTRGSFLFTHFGYSGPAALDFSRHWHRAEGSERSVDVSFAPGETRERLLGAWLAAAADGGRRTPRQLLAERVPERLADLLCREAGVDPVERLSQVDRERRSAVIERVVARALPVTGTLGYEKAEVTAGGVRLDEVDPSTLASRKVPGLYLCGEILDVEGRLGGFNFQWAWSTGTVAGRASALALQRAP